jgi:hypothetical protein
VTIQRVLLKRAAEDQPQNVCNTLPLPSNFPNQRQYNGHFQTPHLSPSLLFFSTRYHLTLTSTFSKVPRFANSASLQHQLPLHTTPCTPLPDTHCKKQLQIPHTRSHQKHLNSNSSNHCIIPVQVQDTRCNPRKLDIATWREMRYVSFGCRADDRFCGGIFLC